MVFPAMSNSKDGVAKEVSWWPALPDNMAYDVLLKSIHMLQGSKLANGKKLSLLWKPTKLVLQKCGPGFSVLWLIQGKFNGILVLILKNGLTIIVTAARSSVCTVLCIDPSVLDENTMPVVDFVRRGLADHEVELRSFYNSAIFLVQSSYKKFAKVAHIFINAATPATAMLTLHFKDVLQAMYENIDINGLLSEALFYLQKLFDRCTVVLHKGMDLYRNSNCRDYLQDMVLSAVLFLKENKTLILEYFKNIFNVLFKLVQVLLPASITCLRTAYKAARLSCKLVFGLVSELVSSYPVVYENIAQFTFKASSLISSVALKTISLLLELRPYAWATAKDLTLRYCKLFMEITPLIVSFLKELCIEFFKVSYEIHTVVWPACYAASCRIYRDLKPALYIFYNDILPRIIIVVRNMFFISRQIILNMPHVSLQLTLQTCEVFSYYTSEINPVVLAKTKDISVYGWNMLNSIESGMSMAVHDFFPSMQPTISQQLHLTQYGLNVVSSDILQATKCIAPVLYSGYREMCTTLANTCHEARPLVSAVCFVVYPDILNAIRVVTPFLLSGLVKLSSDAHQALCVISPEVWLAACTATPVLWQAVVEVTPTTFACTVEAGVKTGVVAYVVYGALCSASVEVSTAFAKAAVVVNKDISKGCFRVVSDAKTLFLETQGILSTLGNKTLPICTFAVHETMTLIWIVRYYDVHSRAFRSASDSQMLIQAGALQYNIASMVKRKGKRVYGLTLKFALRGKIYFSKSNEIALLVMYETNMKVVQCYQKMSPLICALAWKTCAYLNAVFPTENTSISYAYVACLKAVLVFNDWFLDNDVSTILALISDKSLLLMEIMTYNVCLNLFKTYPVIFNSTSRLSQCFWSAVRSVVPEIWSHLCEVSPIVWQILCQIIHTTWNYATKTTPPLYKLVCEQNVVLWEFVSLVMPKIHAILEEVSPQVWGLFCDGISSLWHLLCQKCPMIWDFVCETLPPFWQQICSSSSENWRGLVELITNTWTLICTSSFMGWKMNCILISSAWNSFFFSNLLALSSLQNVDPLLLECISKCGSLLWKGLCIAVIITLIMHEYNYSIKSLFLEPPHQNAEHNLAALVGKDAMEVDPSMKSLQLLESILNDVTSLRLFLQNAKSMASYYLSGRALKSSLTLSKGSFITSCKKISTKLIPKRILKSDAVVASTSRRLTSFFRVTSSLDIMPTIGFIF